MEGIGENGRANASKLGIAIIGLGGAVGTTTVAGALLIAKGKQSTVGLPLADHPEFGLIDYRQLAFAGWDLYPDDLYTAAIKHRVLSAEQLQEIEPELRAIQPWPAIANQRFCAGIEVASTGSSLNDQLEQIASQLTEFAARHDGRVIVINSASTEHPVDLEQPVFQNPTAFAEAVERNSESISPAMLYAYAAIRLGIPYANFTPSVAADLPALQQLAKMRQVPIAGKDGKTGQTFLKTVIAPALRDRSLQVAGWYSTNILGNRDGLVLDKPDSRQSKINTKGDVLDACLGYPVENHQVHIHYYPPRGDDKEAWDNIDVQGFLGQPMQIKVNFLCKDSILAAPLVIEIARCLDLAKQTGLAGPIEQLGAFFKAPMTADGAPPNHRFFEQQLVLLHWLEQQTASLQTASSTSSS